MRNKWGGRMNIITIFAVTFQITIIGDWTQNDWSGGNGQLFWGDTTMYWQADRIDGFHIPGELTLSFPNPDSFIKLFNLREGKKALCITQAPNDTIYVGTSGTPGLIYKFAPGGTPVEKEVWPDIFGVSCVAKPLSGNYTHAGGTNAGGTIMFRSMDEINWGWTLAGGGETRIYDLVATPETLIVGNGNSGARIYISADYGNSYSLIHTFNDEKLLSLFRAQDGVIYAGTGDTAGLVGKSFDNGVTWDTTLSRPGGKSVYAFTQGENGIIYAAADSMVFKTLDAGTSWVATFCLPGVLKVRSLAGCGNFIYAGTECVDGKGRIFYTEDEGITWNDGKVLPEVASVLCLLVETSTEDLYAGTDYNASIFKSSKYFSNGSLVSSVYDSKIGNGNIKYISASWNATIDSSSQSIIVKIRSSQDSTMTGATSWNDCPAITNGQDSLDTILSVQSGDRYIQYRAEFSTSDLNTSPILHDITITYYTDKEGPSIEAAIAYGDEQFVPPDSIITNDRVIISFDESVAPISIDSSNIDSLLKLSNEHVWTDSFGNISSTCWDSTRKILTITLGKDGWSKWVNVGDTVYPSVCQNDSISDKWGNLCTSPCVITGSFGPVIDSIIAYEGSDSTEHIDDDDYINLYFSKRTNKPLISQNNIDSVLQVPYHTWLDGIGELRGDSAVWDSLGIVLTCSLKIDSLMPTISVGDTVWPDSITILDKFERGVVVSPCVISGSFGEYGPVMNSAIAQEGWPEEPGLGDGDYVYIFFNKLVDTIPWISLDIDTVLIAQANGVAHTWHPESLDCFVQQFEQQDAQGIPYTILYVSFKKWGIEEHDSRFTIYDSQLESYPNPFSKVIYIKYQIPGTGYQVPDTGKQNTGPPSDIRHLTSEPQLSSVVVGDTIYPNPNIIKDLGGRSATKPVVLQGEFKKSQITSHDSQLTILIQSSEAIQSVETHCNASLQPSRVSLRIYNLSGQLVRTLVDELKTPGEYKVQWDGLDGQGKSVKNGIYFYKLNVNGHTLTRKTTLLR